MFDFLFGSDHPYDERCVCRNCMNERRYRKHVEEIGRGITTMGGIFPYAMAFGATTIGETTTPTDRNQVIRDMIADALAKEDYELAAKLRDQLTT